MSAPTVTERTERSSIERDLDAVRAWRHQLEVDAIGRQPTPEELLEAELVAAMLERIERARLAA